MTNRTGKSSSKPGNTPKPVPRTPGVGDEIRAVRKARGITLQQLSEQAGCSVAYMSRIERGEARISTDMLTTIGQVLGVDPKWFFPTRAGKGSNEKSYVVRAGTHRPLSNLYTRSEEELGFEDQLLSSSLAGDCYMMLTRFPPLAERQSALRNGYAYEGEQHGLVIEGSIELLLDDEVIVLNTGDSFSYPTEIPHRLRNHINRESVVVFTMTPVRISW